MVKSIPELANWMEWRVKLCGGDNTYPTIKRPIFTTAFTQGGELDIRLVRPIMVTGGNAHGAHDIAKQAGMIYQDIEVILGDVNHDNRPEDIRGPFERFGHVKDVYLPKDYYTAEPRGFGFVQFRDPNDAADAKYNLDRTIVGDQEITVVFAEENRKKPQEMRK